MTVKLKMQNIKMPVAKAKQQVQYHRDISDLGQPETDIPVVIDAVGEKQFWFG